MRIGMVSIWFHRGQSEVTRTIRRALIDNGHEVFIFARMGGVFGRDMQEKDDPYWNLPDVHFYPKYEIPAQVLAMWAKVNRLDTIIFNEEYSPLLGMAIRSMGVKTVQYVDFVSEKWTNGLREGYDALWSATSRTSLLLREMGLGDITTHIGWGVQPSTLHLGDETPKYDFFHNAGWLGINFRKGTDIVIRALSRLFYAGSRYTTLIHSQVPIHSLTSEIYLIACHLERNGALEWRHDTVPVPGLYHLGKVCVQPSRLEGLGLTLVEALWQGRSLITTDAPPMNEFVKHAEYLVQPESVTNRSDGLSFPECAADVDELVNAMQWSLRDWRYAGRKNRQVALYIFNWTSFCSRISSSLQALEA